MRVDVSTIVAGVVAEPAIAAVEVYYKYKVIRGNCGITVK
jgi:hypothetical protein